MIDTDRELLEYAAKAAGFQNYTMRGAYVFVETGAARGNSGYYWNPLADDGDALRLAVKLKIDIRPSMSGSSKFRYAVYDGHTYGEVDHDPLAATRRAIVRAAAEIGKAMV